MNDIVNTQPLITSSYQLIVNHLPIGCLTIWLQFTQSNVYLNSCNQPIVIRLTFPLINWRLLAFYYSLVSKFQEIELTIR